MTHDEDKRVIHFIVCALTGILIGVIAAIEHDATALGVSAFIVLHGFKTALKI